MDGNAFPSPRARRWVLGWLGASCVGILLMIMIGGITRLTESGLSIVEWDLFRGVMPPVSQAGWEEMFAKYQGSPQHRILYPEMTLDEFRAIFWWEYIHRLWGRGLGLLFGLPLLIFWIKGWLRGAILGWCLVALVLGGAQGFLGWFMVQSGLVDSPRVSGYRLTAHLLLAATLLGGLFWLLLKAGNFPRSDRLPTPFRWTLAGLTGLVLLQIGLGGFMAGTQAALVAPTFPLINGTFLPPTAFGGPNLLRDLFENPFTLQFLHRSVAYILMIGTTIWAIGAWPHVGKGPAQVWVAGLPIAILLQGVFGVATVVHSVGVIPVGWGVLHQVFGVATFLWALAALFYFTGRSRPQDEASNLGTRETLLMQNPS
ncbi:MAG: COX15/CtaA family protein [Verrucomicrobiia bacterium]